MADIKVYLDNIKNAILGRDVRSSIYCGIDAINRDQEQLRETFNQIVISEGASNSEIVASRVDKNGNSFNSLSDRLNYLNGRINKSHISVEDFGIQEGLDVNVELNTQRFQEMIDYCKNDKVIVFPAGDYVFNEVNLGEKNNITIKGASSPFASFAQKNIYTGAFNDKFTRIICNADPGKTFFDHKSCILILEDIAFYRMIMGTL